MKKYKTWEVIKMLTENPQLQFKGQYDEVLKSKQIFKSDYLNCSSKTGKMYLNYDWELIQESVTFEEVLNSDKLCKVNHKILNDLRKEYCLDEEFDAQYLIEELNILEVFLPFTDCMYHLANLLNERQLKEVIKNGRWHLE